jgi:hypothetical protein
MAGNVKHGLAGTPEYDAWAQIKNKCTNPRCSVFAKFKGKMFASWIHSFPTFYADVGARPSSRHRLVRVHQDGDYEPSNVRWVAHRVAVEEPQIERPPEEISALVGHKFGRLLVDRVKLIRVETGNLYYRAECTCVCGNTKEIYCHSLKPTSSCGCDKSSYAKTTGALNYRFKGFEEIRAGFWNGYKEGAVRRGIAFDLTMEYAWTLFMMQGRLCALSGVPLVFGAGRSTNTTASLDRLDITQGYVKGNVQWVHKNINLMRNVLPVTDFVAWCQKVAAHSSSDSSYSQVGS